MYCSVVIPTIGRQSVSRAVHSVLDQAFTAEEFEIIVVNDSGQPLPDADWHQSDRVQIITTNRRERCMARNVGAAIAKGRYLCFLDDDDWLLPNAFQHFWELSNSAPDAVWLYGGLRIVDETGDCLAEVNSGLNGNCFAQIMGGAWAPIQASQVQTEAFFTVGGYNLAIIVTEDLDLCRRIAQHGEFANTPAPIACLLRGQTWDTSSNYLRAPEDTLRSRETVLSEPGSFSRLLVSARSSSDPSYWYGRIFRVYLSTALFNLRLRRLFSAISRALFGIAWFASAGRHTLSQSFWDGVKAHHAPNTLHFVIEALERQAEQQAPGTTHLAS